MISPNKLYNQEDMMASLELFTLDGEKSKIGREVGRNLYGVLWESYSHL
jgi:hypothetical protein